jgi:hypothetical protein
MMHIRRTLALFVLAGVLFATLVVPQIASATAGSSAQTNVIIASDGVTGMPALLSSSAQVVPGGSGIQTQDGYRYSVDTTYTGFGSRTDEPYPAAFNYDRVSRHGFGGVVGDNAGDYPDKFKVRIMDASGRRAAGWVYWLKPGQTDIPYQTKLICPSTKRAIRFNPKYAIIVALAVGECGQEASVPTRGTVRFTYIVE